MLADDSSAKVCVERGRVLARGMKILLDKKVQVTCLQVHRFGGELQEIPVPTKTSVIIKVAACALSPVTEQSSEAWLVKDKSQLLPIGRSVAGEVTVVGSEVTGLSVGDQVVGVLPVTSDSTGCAQYCMLDEHDVVKKPGSLSATDAAGSLADCVRAYTALHYLGHVTAGDTVLIMDGATGVGCVMVQLAQYWGAKVITTASSRNEYSFLERMQPPIGHIIEVGDKTKYLSSSVMEETGGLGVDCVIDNGVRQFTTEEEDKPPIPQPDGHAHFVPHKHDLLSCLGVCGKWVTSQHDLQLDPPDSLQLYMRGASVCFLFDPVWTLAHSQQGRYQHILCDAVDKLERKIIKAKIHKVVSFEEVTEALESLSDVRIGKVVVKIT